MNNKKILGGILGSFDETEYEKESSIVSTIVQGVGEVLKSTASSVKEAIKFSSGSIDFKNTPAQNEQLQEEQKKQEEEREKIERRKIFFQALKEDTERAEKEKEKLLFEEEINDIVTNLPTEQKNQLLHYQASYRDRSVYQRSELRKKLIEQKKNAEKQEKAASIPSPAKQPSAMEGAFEGRSGTQGSGSANLSNQAVG
ncbi:hypothetical protein A3J19_02270 [Candidatus Daviesbacteria bacterium RIFCSPLOWO2_02_FULL_41_8]|uniref:Uncharacterized protein n=3 Tax=Candidatus Daviesiibacteriota TaxID=1752718 RepID=A0A1F5NHH9_9BACT|nr:MAG: hypothetical protein A2871_01265 [Candidatus Daviesbacteria bacterium RIFCSPHIGHO2_01_FULL_41_23]OGE32670.1 MAG: hypothetical protein A3D83_01630 [Candidatus Daviesbacteria bacterium RIFCSPHIGHO2_02_FULL_41_10]OGE62523.1 MAG: hypothetical protein A2967_01750 [Candidatus Daviesbacteria bacterium RIFCSPLOWO2_01_FULL_41_32]OGE77119.1 MAG: hypothetical protein A3J19_02270 [Candidatus Daviesbacteria bacterium RIFCSPLOWO2_02_FULL_41_8]